MDDTAFIAALQLTDSFFPSGTVTLSHGLETFLSGQSAALDLSQLLQDYLERKIAPCDLVAYAHAYRAAEEGDAERLHQLDRYLNVSLLPQELRQGSARSGRATLETLRRLVEEPLFQAFLAGIEAGKSSGHIPICLGLLHVLWRIPQRRGGAMLLYTFVVNFLGAAIRLGCLGHREAHEVAHQLPTSFDSTRRSSAREPTRRDRNFCSARGYPRDATCPPVCPTF